MMAEQKHHDQSRKTEGSHLEPQQEAESEWEGCVAFKPPALSPTTSLLQQGHTS